MLATNGMLLVFLFFFPFLFILSRIALNMRLPSTRVTVASNEKLYLCAHDPSDVRIGYADDMQIDFRSDSKDFVDVSSR